MLTLAACLDRAEPRRRALVRRIAPAGVAAAVLAFAALCGPVALSPVALAQEAVGAPPDLSVLERRWHKCVRHAFAGQTGGTPTHAAQKAALSECKTFEDAYVSAMLVAQAAEADVKRQGGQSFGSKARNWASSVLSYVVDPVSSWIEAWRR